MDITLPGIRARRKAAGLTLEELASAVGCTPQAISCWERGQTLPTADRLPQLAAALGCSIDELYAAPGEDPSTSRPKDPSAAPQDDSREPQDDSGEPQDDRGARPEDAGGASSAPTDDYNQEV